MINMKEDKLSVKNIDIKISIILYTVKYFLDRSAIPGFSETLLSNILLYLSIAPILFFIGRKILIETSALKQRKRIKYTIMGFGIIVVSLLIFQIIPYVIYVYTLMLIVAARHIDSNVIIQTVKKSMIAMLLIIALCALVGVIPNVSTVAGRYNLGLENRMYGWYIFNYSAIELYYRRKKRIITYAWLIFFNILVYYFTKTRLSFYLFIIILMLSVLEDHGKRFGRRSRKILSYTFIIMFVAAIILTINYASFPALENVLSGRPRFGMRVLSAYGIRLWPRNIAYFTQQIENGSYTMYVDSGYIDLLVRFGVVITAVVIITYTFLLRKAAKINNYRWFIWLVIIALFNLVNNSFFNIFYDCSIILFWNTKEILDTKRFSAKSNGRIVQ